MQRRATECSVILRQLSALYVHIEADEFRSGFGSKCGYSSKLLSVLLLPLCCFCWKALSVIIRLVFHAEWTKQTRWCLVER